MLSPEEERIDPTVVRRYFEAIGTAASAASSMAHARKLPVAASLYRKECELTTLKPWLDAVPKTATVLDAGCGDGYWTAVFSARYRRVVAMDQSPAMIAAARDQVSGLQNVEILSGDITSDLPHERFDLIFAGGVCMYLNDADVEALLRSFCDRLTERGVIILRESTVRVGRRALHGDYQVIYRNVDAYRDLCHRSRTHLKEVRKNIGYERFEIAADIADAIPGRSLWVWPTLRAIAPLSFVALPRFMDLTGVAWPRLQNHFFLLTKDSSNSAA